MSDLDALGNAILSELTIEDLDAFGRGAALLGAGGGGNPYVGRLVLEHELRKGRQARIIGIEDLDDAALVIPILMMGAPTVMIEKVPSVEALALALSATEARLGRKADALIPIEVGGINSMVPLVLGARLGLPIVNADGMGRAFPEIQMVTFGIYGNPISPVTLANESGEVVQVMATSNLMGERLGRAVVAQMGGTAHVACYPMSGAETKRTAIRDTLALALRMGRAVHAGKGDALEATLFKALRELPEPRAACILFEGKIVDVLRETRGGFNRGNVSIEAMGSTPDRLTVVFQNENLIAYRNDVAVATTPDIITVVDSETADTITTDALKFGQRVKVLGIGVPPLMRTDAALRVIGPRAFGIAQDYMPMRRWSDHPP